MDRRIVVGVAVLAVGGFFYIRHRSTPASGTNGLVVDPNGPTSIAQQAVNVQGVTDANGNLATQFTWPYNQLALPYNFDQATGNLGNYTNPQSNNFVGYNSTQVF